MRIVEIEKFKAMRKKFSFNTGMFIGIPVAVIIFLLTVSGGFFGAILFGLLVGGALFAVIYLLRELTHKGVDSKYRKIDIQAPCIEVMHNREMGLLEFYDDVLVYHPLTPGGFEKKLEIPITENLFIGAGDIIQTKIQSFRFKGIIEAQVTVKELPHGVPHQFVFFNIDNCLEDVLEIITRISKYVPVG